MLQIRNDTKYVLTHRGKNLTLVAENDLFATGATYSKFVMEAGRRKRHNLLRYCTGDPRNLFTRTTFSTKKRRIFV